MDDATSDRVAICPYQLHAGPCAADRATEVMVPDSEVTELCAWHRAQERERILGTANDPRPLLYAAAVLEGQPAAAFAVCRGRDATDLKSVAVLLRKLASELA